MSESPPAAPDDTPKPNSPVASPASAPASPRRAEGFDVARVLRIVALGACVLSAAFAALGVIVTVRHIANEIPPGVITRVEPLDGHSRLHLDGGRSATVPADILVHAGEPIELRPGMPVSKRIGSLTYTIDHRPRGGAAWALRHWLLPARVTLPLVVYFVLSWLLVFRATEHHRPIAVELFILPLLRWLALAGAMLLVMAVISGCAYGCGQLLFRMGG